jgi:hypothetical protein
VRHCSADRRVPGYVSGDMGLSGTDDHAVPASDPVEMSCRPHATAAGAADNRGAPGAPRAAKAAPPSPAL